MVEMVISDHFHFYFHFQPLEMEMEMVGWKWKWKFRGCRFRVEVWSMIVESVQNRRISQRSVDWQSKI